MRRKEHEPERNRRILVIDDLPDLHADFRKLLCPRANAAALEVDRFASELLGQKQQAARSEVAFQVDCALQGKQGLELVRRALEEGQPYAMAFVDMRMPPGWDGLETVEAIWREDPDLEVVISTAYSDYSEEELAARLGATDQLLILKKPFDPVEVRQLALALTEKWTLRQLTRVQTAELERRAARRTRELSAVNLLLAAEMKRHEETLAELHRAEHLAAAGTLAAGVAAELETSLQRLSSSVEALERRAASEAGAEALSQAAQATRRMAGLVKGLSRVASAAQPPRATLDINRALTSALEVFSEGIRACADLKVDLATLPPIECSPADLNLVLIGLVDSAIGAVEEARKRRGGLGRIAVSTRLEQEEAVIRVSDSGEGFRGEMGDKLFAPYFAGGEGGRAARPGLAAAWAIVVSQHGGRLAVESEPGGGATLVVRLPLRARTPEQPAGAVGTVPQDARA
jgi:two-component system, NtrC family, sensor kinase